MATKKTTKRKPAPKAKPAPSAKGLLAAIYPALGKAGEAVQGRSNADQMQVQNAAGAMRVDLQMFARGKITRAELDSKLDGWKKDGGWQREAAEAVEALL